MRYRVEVKNPCRCFLRDAGIESELFETKEEAQEAAEALQAHMQKTYCKQHRFDLTETVGNYTITIRPRN